ncbi:MAG TPA: N-acetylmuramoyl-L-alanine amidase [Chitinophagaceae bacterium]|jgi:N-acetylmuramoyl-L-alanine amidase|nr:N-acetylmuramoyl-L-alanine amidase [Chitinophagaceae bacterium]
MIRFCIVICLFSGLAGSSQPLQPLVGRTTGALPYLEYGLGTDRLGGAKMGYLDTSIVVKVIDSTIGNYKVQLSKDHMGYLPKSNFKKDSTVKVLPFYLTNSWMVSGDDKYDYLMVNLDEKLPYRSVQQINPSKIVIDVFGATNNTNWITQRSSAKEIKNVYHEQIEDDVFRVTIELKNEQHWGYSIYYREKRLIIKVKRQPADLSLENIRVAVDAGHGGDNNGASGVKTGILEKNYTLLIAKELEKELLDKGAKVFMTRTKDTSLGMIERTEMLKKEDPDFLVSIHLNSSVRDSIGGVSTYYRYIGFRPLTQYIQESMLKTGLRDFGNIGSFNFALSGPTDYPNCLVEVAFLSNKEDEQLILDPEFHKAVAKQIVEGIKEWLKSCKKDN